MAKKKVAAVVKIQIPAGQATPAPPVGTALGPHGVAIMDFCKAYNAADREPARHDRPGRDHHLRGPLVHVHPEDAADAGAAAPGGRPRQGLGRPRARGRRHGHRRPGRRDRQDQDARPQRQRPRGRQAAGRRAPPARWASRSSSTGTSPPGRPHRRTRSPRRDIDAEGKKLRRHPKVDRSSSSAARRRPAKTWPAKFDETIELAVRLGVDPRKADQMVRGTVALPSGTGQGRPGRRVRRRRRRRRGPGRGCRLRRRRRPRRRGRGRHARLRRRHRHARPHAAGRPARPHPRPAWPDAEPQDRHRHHRRRQGRRRVQGRQGRVPHRPLRQRPRARSARPASSPTRWSPTSAPCSTSSSGPSRPRPRAATSRASRSLRPWAPASTSTPTVCGKRPSLRSLSQSDTTRTARRRHPVRSFER